MPRKQPEMKWTPHDMEDEVAQNWTARDGDLSLSVNRNEDFWSFSIRRDGKFVFDKTGRLMTRRGSFATSRDAMTRCEARAKEIHSDVARENAR